MNDKKKNVTEEMFSFNFGDRPIIATAIHDGHKIRDEIAPLFAIGDLSRLREEDPFTGQWTKITDNTIVVRTSRFEVDLNRAREEAVYIRPDDAWGLNVWKTTPSQEMIDQSLAKYDSFYSDIHKIFTDLQNRFGQFVVFDFHSYNHRRMGPDAQAADPELNPEVNVGTGTMIDRTQWAPVIDRFIKDLSEYDYLGRHLDVRENVKFYGRQFAQWTHENFTDAACVLSIEFKKFFMDEWSGKPDDMQIQAISDALKFTVPGVLEELYK